MKTISLPAFFSVCLLSACATTTPDLSAIKEDRIPVPVKRIVVNEAEENELEASLSELFLSSAYVPLSDTFTIPPFPQIMHNNLSARLSAEGPEGSGTLMITPLRSTIYLKMRVVDSIPFVSVFSALSPRGYLCQTVLDFDYMGKNTLKEFNAPEVRSNPRLDDADRADLIRRCVDRLMMDIADFSAELVGPSADNPL